jgi:ureidoacrylate peracid hydrolase
MSLLKDQEQNVAPRNYSLYEAKTSWKIIPSETAFLSIDLQVSFVDERGALYLGPGSRSIIPNTNRLAKECRDLGIPVIWIKIENTPYNAGLIWEVVPEEGGKYTGFKGIDGEMLIWPGTKGAQFVPELDIQPQDIQVTKIRYSAFIPGSSNLPSILQALKRRTLIMTGIASNVCLMATAIDAMMLDYRVIVVKDASATISQAAHDQIMDLLGGIFGQVTSTEKVISELHSYQRRIEEPIKAG